MSLIYCRYGLYTIQCPKSSFSRKKNPGGPLQGPRGDDFLLLMGLLGLGLGFFCHVRRVRHQEGACAGQHGAADQHPKHSGQALAVAQLAQHRGNDAAKAGGQAHGDAGSQAHMVGHQLLPQRHRGAEGQVQGHGQRDQHQGGEGHGPGQNHRDQAGDIQHQPGADDLVEAEFIRQAPADQGRNGAGNGQNRGGGAGNLVRLQQHAHPEQRDKGAHADADGGAQEHHTGQLAEGFPIVLLAGGLGLFRGLAALLGKFAQLFALAQQESGHQHSGDRQNSGAFHAKLADAEHRQHGPHSAAQVAADGKVAHAPALVLAGHIVGHPASVRVEQGGANAGEGHRHKHRPIVIQKAQHGNAAARHKDAQAHHPGPGMLIRHIAEHRLDNRADAAQRKSQARGRSQGNALLRHQKRQDRRQSAAADIGA